MFDEDNRNISMLHLNHPYLNLKSVKVIIQGPSKKLTKVELNNLGCDRSFWMKFGSLIWAISLSTRSLKYLAQKNFQCLHTLCASNSASKVQKFTLLQDHFF